MFPVSTPAEQESRHAESHVRSLPALVAAMRSSYAQPGDEAHRHLFRREPLVPMYRIAGDSAEAEAASAVQVVQEVTERLRRLASAYGEWAVFDASAYFDLSRAQTGRLVRIAERVNTVHVTFFVDPLLPSFQETEAYWTTQFLPAYATTRRELRRTAPRYDVGASFFEGVQPEMIARLQNVVRTLQTARSLLQHDLGFLGMNDGENERARWQHAWLKAPTPGLDPSLTLGLNEIPTLTLAYDFPLPTYRQSGRVRRLRENRRRQQQRRTRGRHS